MDDADCAKKIKSRTTSSQGYSVRRSEEALSMLQKENFNLKLKLYCLENKFGVAQSSEIANVCDKEYIDLFIENETLKSELNDKKDIMKNALDAIEMLEDQKCLQEKKSSAIIKEQTRKIDALKTRSKMLKKAALRKNPFNSLEPHQDKVSKLDEDIRALKSQNTELFARINDLKKDVTTKSCLIEKVSKEKQQLLRDHEATNKKLKECEKAMTDLREMFAKSRDSQKLQGENENLKSQVYDLTERCRKFEKKSKELERLITEQSCLLKALNRTIDTKNEELLELKLSMDFKSTPVVETKIDLSGDGNFEKSQFPFHNPLFGSFNSLYR